MSYMYTKALAAQQGCKTLTVACLTKYFVHRLKLIWQIGWHWHMHFVICLCWKLCGKIFSRYRIVTFCSWGGLYLRSHLRILNAHCFCHSQYFAIFSARVSSAQLVKPTGCRCPTAFERI